MRKNHKLTRPFSIGNFAVIGLLAITACVTGAQPTNASPPLGSQTASAAGPGTATIVLTLQELECCAKTFRFHSLVFQRFFQTMERVPKFL